MPGLQSIVGSKRGSHWITSCSRNANFRNSAPSPLHLSSGRFPVSERNACCLFRPGDSIIRLESRIPILNREEKRSITCNSAENAPGPTTSSTRVPCKVWTLPTILTVARVFAIPILIGVWYHPADWAPLACTSIFALAAFTDFLDGYLARKMASVSAFGAFLDPVADKLMVATVLILLCTQPVAAGPWAGNAWFIPVLASMIIGREITMSALREWAAALGGEAHKAVAVSSWGKWKTATQMTAIPLLVLNSRGGVGLVYEIAGFAGLPLLCVATLLTVWSLALYMQAIMKFM